MNSWETILVVIALVTIVPLLLGINSAHGDGSGNVVRGVLFQLNHNSTSGIELTGNVTHVVDGDTLDVNGIRIRLSLVDTPERGQPGFKEAKGYVTSLCLGKRGELDVDDGQRRGDRYGREIGVVYCNGVNINEKLINQGLARILTDYCDISEFSNKKWAAACNSSITLGQ